MTNYTTGARAQRDSSVAARYTQHACSDISMCNAVVVHTARTRMHDVTRFGNSKPVVHTQCCWLGRVRFCVCLAVCVFMQR